MIPQNRSDTPLVITNTKLIEEDRRKLKGRMISSIKVLSKYRVGKIKCLLQVKSQFLMCLTEKDNRGKLLRKIWKYMKISKMWNQLSIFMIGFYMNKKWINSEGIFNNSNNNKKPIKGQKNSSISSWDQGMITWTSSKTALIIDPLLILIKMIINLFKLARCKELI